MERLKELRKEAKLSQEDIARRLNVSKQAVCLYETGKSEPTIKSIISMCKMFGVTSDYLIGLSDVKTNENALQGLLLDKIERLKKAEAEIIKIISE
jgi:transcriptional regulator with XRE-family HTH domain